MCIRDRDWDGTIADTVPTILEAHHQATEALIGYRLDDAQIRARIGEPARRRIGSLVGPARAHDVFLRYSGFMEGLDPGATTLFEGIGDILNDADAAGFKNVIVTSRPRAQVSPALQRLKLGEIVRGVIGLEDTVTHKPQPEPLLRGADLAGTVVPNCVYIGDAAVDIRAAQAAGMPCIAVTWGAGAPLALANERPDLIVTSVEELREVLMLHAIPEEEQSA